MHDMQIDFWANEILVQSKHRKVRKIFEILAQAEIRVFTVSLARYCFSWKKNWYHKQIKYQISNIKRPSQGQIQTFSQTPCRKKQFLIIEVFT